MKLLQLRHYLLLPISLILLVLMAILFLVDKGQLHGLSESATYEINNQVAYHVTHKLNAYLEEAEKLTAFNRYLLSEKIVQHQVDLESLLPLFWSQMQSYETVGAVFIGMDNDEFIGYTRTGDAQIHMMRAGEGTGYTIEYYRVDGAGQPGDLVTTSQKFYSTQRPWYRAAQETSEPIWLNPDRDPALPLVFQRLSVRLQDSTGRAIGVFGTYLIPKNINGYLSEIDLGTNGAIFVIDEKQRIIASSFPIENPGEPQQIIPEKSGTLVSRLLQREGRVNAGADGTDDRVPEKFVFTDANQNYSADIRMFSKAPGINWQLFTIIDRSDFKATSYDRNLKNLLIWLTLSILGLLSCRWIVSIFANPIQNLAIHMQRESRFGKAVSYFHLQPKWLPAPKETLVLYEAFNELVSRNRELLEEQEQEICNKQSLIEQLDRLARIVQLTDSMVMVIDSGNHIVWVNPAFERHSGYDSEEIRGVRFDSVLLGPQTDRDVIARLDVSLAHGRTFSTRVYCYRKNGEGYWAEITVTPIRDEKGKLIETFSVSRDITDQVRYESDLALWRNLFEVAHWGVAISRGSEFPTLIKMNKRMAEMFGYTKEALIGQSPAMLYAAGNESRLQAFIKEIEVKGALTYEARMIRKDGTEFPALINLHQIEDEQGETIRMASIQDLSEIRSLESQLRQSQKIETIGMMASSLVHDFNQILATILVNAELGMVRLESIAGHETGELLELFQNMIRATYQASEVVQQFLLFTRKEVQSFERVDLNVLVRSASSMILPKSLARTELLLELNDEPVNVWAGRSQLHQVLLNLVTNAIASIDDTLRSDGRIRIRTGHVPPSERPDLDSAGSWIRLDVEDNGGGIPQQYRERIFEPLFTTKKKGTGLGLSICQQIVQNHNGFIEFDSKPGQGTCFSIYLPEAVEDVQTDGDGEEPGNPRDPAATRSYPENNRSGNILLVDDDRNITKIWEQLLESRGWSVTSLHDGQVALDEFRIHHDDFRLVITDLCMPGLSGLQLVEHIRKISQSVPIVVCCGYIAPADQNALNDMKVTQILHKPVSSALMDQCLEEIVNGNDEV